jgi:hypothetical protein
VKTSALPPLRVDPKLRKAAESVLREGETLSAFVLDSVQANISNRRAEAEFVARGLASEKRARRSGRYVSSTEVLRKLRERLVRAKSKISPVRAR